uniref:J domain-containing protein n=1 Tax=viral metagenome TaxID=1070528 RepID=A0A6C0BPU4_9ZZZZ
MSVFKQLPPNTAQKYQEWFTEDGYFHSRGWDAFSVHLYHAFRLFSEDFPEWSHDDNWTFNRRLQSIPRFGRPEEGSNQWGLPALINPWNYSFKNWKARVREFQLKFHPDKLPTDHPHKDGTEFKLGCAAKQVMEDLYGPVGSQVHHPWEPQALTYLVGRDRNKIVISRIQTDLEQVIGDLQSRLDAAELGSVELQARVKKLEEKMPDEKSKAQQLGEELAKARAELLEIRRTQLERDAELASVRKQLTKEREAQAKIQDEVKSATVQLALVHLKVGQLQEEIKKVALQRDQALEQTTKLSEELKDVELERDQAQEELELVQSQYQQEIKAQDRTIRHLNQDKKKSQAEAKNLKRRLASNVQKTTNLRKKHKKELKDHEATKREVKVIKSEVKAAKISDQKTTQAMVEMCRDATALVRASDADRRNKMSAHIRHQLRTTQRYQIKGSKNWCLVSPFADAWVSKKTKTKILKNLQEGKMIKNAGLLVYRLGDIVDDEKRGRRRPELINSTDIMKTTGKNGIYKPGKQLLYICHAQHFKFVYAYFAALSGAKAIEAKRELMRMVQVVNDLDVDLDAMTDSLIRVFNQSQ